MRINRYIAASGHCSRREADRLIEAGDVMINGRMAVIGDRVDAHDTVRVKGTVLRPKAKSELVYLALNKPAGITTTTDRRRRDNIIAFLNYPQRVFPIGRLDRDSEGLILLTNDGGIVNRILRVEYGHEKEYEVDVDRPPTADMIRTLEKGVDLDGTMTLPCRIALTGKTSFRIVLKQGLNRQIRRMCEAVGLHVVRLKRIRIMHITLGQLKTGTYRRLTVKEVRDLHQLLDQAETALKTSRPPRKQP